MASTVGTIMALLVFLTFLSLIVNHYVPVWMKDSEAAHMNTALGQFADLKSSIDLQMLAARTAQQARRHYIPVASYSPVTLGVDGVPIFTAPTVGTLETSPSESPWTVWFSKEINATDFEVSEAGSGVVRLDVPNRYFVSQALTYENGGVVRSQSDGQFVRVESPFEVSVSGQSVTLGFALVSLYGSSSISGTGTEGIHHRLIADDQFDHEDLSTDVYINASSRYGLAWYNAFNTSLARAYAVSGEAYGGCSGGTYRFCIDQVGRFIDFVWVDNPYYYVSADWNDAARRYDLIVQIKNDPTRTDPTVPTIDLFSLEHAFVNVAAGSRNAGQI